MVPLIVNAVTRVEVKVTVVAPPPCIINDDRPIIVDFGEVITTRIDDSNNRLPVDYTLSCKDAPYNTMRMKIQGNGAHFDSTVLQTSKNGLGIELQNNKNKFSVNSWLNFIYPNKPDLWVVLVKQRGATLTGGEFTAGATMKVDYQ
jgi:hypothetical protein